MFDDRFALSWVYRRVLAVAGGLRGLPFIWTTLYFSTVTDAMTSQAAGCERAFYNAFCVFLNINITISLDEINLRWPPPQPPNILDRRACHNQRRYQLLSPHLPLSTTKMGASTLTWHPCAFVVYFNWNLSALFALICYGIFKRQTATSSNCFASSFQSLNFDKRYIPIWIGGSQIFLILIKTLQRSSFHMSSHALI